MNTDALKFYIRRLWFRIFVCMVLLLALLNSGLLLGIRGLAGPLQEWVLPGSQPAAISLYRLEGLFWYYFLPGSALLFMVFALFLGGLSGRALKKMPLGTPRAPMRRPAPADAPPVAATRDPDAPRHRLFLHLLSILQRDGRLMDFLYEDLAGYDDAQVGAAVRNIHENCRTVLDKYLAPEAVVAADEGSTIKIPPDFDTSRFTLTGNIKGRPPFNGVVHHRGWQMGKTELPVLLSEKDSRIIAPAEIEIQ